MFTWCQLQLALPRSHIPSLFHFSFSSAQTLILFYLLILSLPPDTLGFPIPVWLHSVLHLFVDLFRSLVNMAKRILSSKTSSIQRISIQIKAAQVWACCSRQYNSCILCHPLLFKKKKRTKEIQVLLSIIQTVAIFNHPMWRPHLHIFPELSVQGTTLCRRDLTYCRLSHDCSIFECCHAWCQYQISSILMHGKF